MIIALSVFAVAYIAIASEKFPRHIVAVLGAAVMIGFGVLTLGEALTYINWDTIGLLAGMFALVAVLIEAGFFKWLALTAVRKVNYHPTYLFIALIVLAALLAMWMDSITVMLFLSALTLQLCNLLKIDPVTLIIAEVCAANTGGSATLVGDPPNVILGTTLGFNFGDFITHTGPISAVASLLLLGVFLYVNRKHLGDAHAALTDDTIREVEALHKDPLHAQLTRVGLIGFGVAVTLLVTHHWLSDIFHIEITAAMSALIPAGLVLVFSPGIERTIIVKRLVKHDLENLVFFAGLFMLIGGLEKSQAFVQVAALLTANSASNPAGLVFALHWGPGLLSGVVDNVPLALAMSYVLKDIASVPGMPALALMVWSLALGVNLGGNLTPIGASANVVAYSYLERNHGKVGWTRWLKIAALPTIATMLLASALLLVKGNIGWY